MPAVTGATTGDELVACPCCRGVVGFIELHDGGHYQIRIEHHCSVCRDRGILDRARARAWWLSRSPTA